MAALLGSVLAHQGGWDEILFVLAPLLVFAGLLHLARKRAEELDHTDDEASTGGPTDVEPTAEPDRPRPR